MTRQTQDQRLASIEAELARIKGRDRRSETAEKVIAGVVAITEAEQNPAFAKLLLDLADKHLVRPVDRQRWKPFADRLKQSASEAKQSAAELQQGEAG